MRIRLVFPSRCSQKFSSPVPGVQIVGSEEKIAWGTEYCRGNEETAGYLRRESKTSLFGRNLSFVPRFVVNVPKQERQLREVMDESKVNYYTLVFTEGPNASPSHQLSLALIWNRADIAKCEIFREDRKWEV